MSAIMAEIKYSVWLYFLPITNPRAAWEMLRSLFRTSVRDQTINPVRDGRADNANEGYGSLPMQSPLRPNRERDSPDRGHTQSPDTNGDRK